MTFHPIHSMFPIQISFFQTILPSVLSAKDSAELVQSCLKSHSTAIVCQSTIVASDSLVTESGSLFTQLMAHKAQKVTSYTILCFSYTV